MTRTEPGEAWVGMEGRRVEGEKEGVEGRRRRGG